jgi:DNA-directed RNA polymerase subunit RPC12/RpoP
MSEQSQQSQAEQMQKLMHNGTDLACNNCGSITFYHANRVRFFVAEESPNGQEGIHPMDEYVCCNCGEVLDIESEASKAKANYGSES